MLRPISVALAALALVAAAAGSALAQETPKPPKPADPKPADKTPGESEEEPTLRNRLRPELQPMLPKRDGVVELRVGLFGGFVLGAARKDGDLLLGTRFEFDSELDMDPIAMVPVIDATVHLSDRLSISLDFLAATMAGSRLQGSQTAFDGLNFPAGTPVSADLTILSSSIAARYFASTSERGNFEIEAGIRYLGVDFEIEGVNGGVVVETRETTDAFIPFVGFLGTINVARWRKDWFQVEGRLRFGILGIGDSEDNQTNFYAHAFVGVSLPLPPLRRDRFNVRLSLGYEFFRIDAEREDSQFDEDFEIGFHGPVFRLIVRF